MGERWVRVIADDLTGACDVGAALLPYPMPVIVETLERMGQPASTAGAALVVRNTQSRTLTPLEAADRVRRALGDVPPGQAGVLLKKIDTALRGALGAEIEAAMDAVGADVTLVLAAIPEVGRTTVDGRQLIDGVPVDQTAFARDPQNPIRDPRIANVIAETTRQPVACVRVTEMRRAGARHVLATRRASGTRIVVGDAESDADLDGWITGITMGPRSIVLAGSTGLAKAWRRAGGAAPAASWVSPRTTNPGRGVLVVAGSAHPNTRGQLRHVAASGLLAVIEASSADPVGTAATVAGLLASGTNVGLVAPAREVSGASAGILETLATTALAVLERTRPAALLLIGGETAFHVLARIGHPRLVVEGEPAPLSVRATLADGMLVGMPIVTKGGSSGPPDRLRVLMEGVTA